MSSSSLNNTYFWNSVIRAVEAEPRDIRTVRGASGLEHPVRTLGVDEERRRVVVVSDEPDARSAAVAHADIQAAMPSLQIVMSRPLAVNLSAVSQALSKAIGKSVIDMDDVHRFNELEAQEVPSEIFKPIIDRGIVPPEVFSLIPMDRVGQVLQAVQQLAQVQLNMEQGQKGAEIRSIELDALSSTDPLELDRQLGVCGIPLYDFTAKEIEQISSGTDPENTGWILKQKDILQYFFPAADHLALGLVDRGLADPDELIGQLLTVPELGHPYGESEFSSSRIPLSRVIEDLRDKNLVAEGEIGYEITEEGRTERASIKFGPREGLVSKLISRINISINLKDIFGYFNNPR